MREKRSKRIKSRKEEEQRTEEQEQGGAGRAAGRQKAVAKVDQAYYLYTFESLQLWGLRLSSIIVIETTVAPAAGNTTHQKHIKDIPDRTHL